jgi:hypothetical protein
MNGRSTLTLSIEGYTGEGDDRQHAQLIQFELNNLPTDWRNIEQLARAILGAGVWSNGATSTQIAQVRVFVGSREELRKLDGAPVGQFRQNDPSWEKGLHFTFMK